jgi:hypothetical protein
MSSKRKNFLLGVKNSLKKLNCCSSECFNKTIENIEIEHVEELYKVISELHNVITNIKEKKQERTTMI